MFVKTIYYIMIFFKTPVFVKNILIKWFYLWTRLWYGFEMISFYTTLYVYGQFQKQLDTITGHISADINDLQFKKYHKTNNICAGFQLEIDIKLNMSHFFFDIHFRNLIFWGFKTTEMNIIRNIHVLNKC